MICVICGGIGGARLARGISYVYDPAALTYICNVGDNIQFFGLSICPDIDAIIYYLSGSADFDRGWGLHDDSFNLLESLRLFSRDFWFGLGDKDMATHIWRSELLHNGASLSEVTARESQLGGIQARVIPATDTWVETWIETAAHAALHYEEYFIRYRCEPRVSRIRYVGIEDSRPAPGVLEAIASSSTILIAPSNPVASVLPIISVPGIREALVSNREKIWAISLVIEALELPAGERMRAHSRERLLAAFGLPHSPVSVGQLYKDFCSHFVLDERDFVCKSVAYYYGKKEATTEAWRNDWFHSGDLAWVDEEGDYYYAGRKKASMRRRGENISAWEIESVVNQHPAVLESAAHAVPSELSEDEIKLVVVLKPGQTATPEQILDFCQGKMAHYAIPRYVELRDSLPKTGTHRIEYSVLKEEAFTARTWDREAVGYIVSRDQ